VVGLGRRVLRRRFQFRLRGEAEAVEEERVKPHSVPHLPTGCTAMLKLIEMRFNVPGTNSTRRDATTGDMTDPDEPASSTSVRPICCTCHRCRRNRPMAGAMRRWRARRIHHSEGQRKGKGLRELQFAEAQFIGKS
jgi:hypothetical protein